VQINMFSVNNLLRRSFEEKAKKEEHLIKRCCKV